MSARVVNSEGGCYQIVGRRLSHHSSPTIRTGFSLSLVGAPKPVRETGVAICVATAQVVRLVKWLDANFAQHKVSHVFYMFLKR